MCGTNGTDIRAFSHWYPAFLAQKRRFEPCRRAYVSAISVRYNFGDVRLSGQHGKSVSGMAQNRHRRESNDEQIGGSPPGFRVQAEEEIGMVSPDFQGGDFLYKKTQSVFPVLYRLYNHC